MVTYRLTQKVDTEDSAKEPQYILQFVNQESQEVFQIVTKDQAIFDAHEKGIEYKIVKA